MEKNYTTLNKGDKQLSFLNQDDGMIKEPILKEVPLFKEDLLRDMKFAEECITIDLEDYHYKVDNAHKIWPDALTRHEIVEDIKRDIRDKEHQLLELRKKIDGLDGELNNRRR